MKEISVNSLDEMDSVVGSDTTVLVKFSKDNCPGCTSLDQVIESKLKNNEAYQGVTLVQAKLEVIGREAFMQMRLRSAPSVVMFKDGEEVYRMSGFTGADSFLYAVSTHLH